MTDETIRVIDIVMSMSEEELIEFISGVAARTVAHSCRTSSPERIALFKQYTIEALLQPVAKEI